MSIVCVMSNDNEPVTKKQLTETLGEFTENVLLPAISSMVDEKLDEKLKDYPTKIDMDRKFSAFEEKMDDKFANLKCHFQNPDESFGLLSGVIIE